MERKLTAEEVLSEAAFVLGSHPLFDKIHELLQHRDAEIARLTEALAELTKDAEDSTQTAKNFIDAFFANRDKIQRLTQERNALRGFAREYLEQSGDFGWDLARKWGLAEHWESDGREGDSFTPLLTGEDSDE